MSFETFQLPAYSVELWNRDLVLLQLALFRRNIFSNRLR